MQTHHTTHSVDPEEVDKRRRKSDLALKKEFLATEQKWKRTNMELLEVLDTVYDTGSLDRKGFIEELTKRVVSELARTKTRIDKLTGRGNNGNQPDTENA